MRFKVLLLLLWSVQLGFAQNEITWSGEYHKLENKVLITAKLKPGWHLYSMHVDEMAGPVSTKIELNKNRAVVEIGSVTEPEPIVSYDDNFEAELQYFENSVTFEHELKVKRSTQLEYTITHMICNNTMCYPPVDEVILITIVK